MTRGFVFLGLLAALGAVLIGGARLAARAPEGAPHVVPWWLHLVAGLLTAAIGVVALASGHPAVGVLFLGLGVYRFWRARVAGASPPPG